ncbi:type I-E CRISPR-associated protein Cse2/CasB [Pseudactinotalea sp. Z1732]|uniref:type I-E CRISPR-associated protein Cse2/CasB n=1 Tax=Pseudactinotalea sp. Z1732 TaxID=3413026 RepID=UPI003C7BE26A
MTAPVNAMEGPDEAPEDAARASRPVRHTPLATAVAARVQHLQAASLKGSPRAVARIAQLRRAVNTAPGQLPDVWEDTIGVVPENLIGREDDPSPAERAAHHALTLFALHRQGKADIAHSTQVSFGGAIRELARRRGGGTGDESPGVRRRFDALVTASTPDEGAYHLRGLVMMLRDAGLSMDYGRLAQDLADLWTPARRDGVRLRWARQYRSRSPRANDDTQDIPTTATTEERS